REQFAADHGPALARRRGVRREIRPQLISAAREMIERDFLSARRAPHARIRLRPPGASESAPRDDRPEPESARERRQRGRMPKRVGTIQNRRRLIRRAQQAQRAAPREQVPDERLTAGNHLVRKYVPRSRFDRAALEQHRQLRRALAPDGEIILYYSGLAIEQERRAFVRGRR